MPQGLIGCPPLEIVEEIVVTQSDVADVSASVQGLERAQPEGDYQLMLAVKNAGPDLVSAPRLAVVLPVGASPHVTSDEDPKTVDDTLVTIRLADLKPGESCSASVAFHLPSPPTAQNGETDLVMVDVRHSAHDPKPGNNGLILRLSTLLKPN